MKPTTTCLAACLALVSLGLSGCVSNAASSPAAVADLGVTEFGKIHGLLVDESLIPVSGARVTLPILSLSVSTDVDGVFVLSPVPAGEQIVVVEAAGYQSISVKVPVTADQTSHVDVTVTRIPTAEAYYVSKIGRGLFGCGATYRQGFTTVNGAFFGIAACGVGAQYHGLDDFIWDTHLSDNITIWRGGAFETEWKSTQALGNGMVQDWAVIGCSNNRNATFTRDTGPSPLRQVMNAFQLDYRLQDLPNSSCKGYERCNLKDCHIMNRMFSWPSTTGQNALIDVGVTIQQTFTTYLTEFYRAEPPPGFTAIPDA